MCDVRIALIGDYDASVVANQAIPRALQLATRRPAKVEGTWVATPSLEQDADAQLAGFHGLWCVPASPYRSMEGALGAIRFARERGTPFLGTCGGFQHVLLEYARSVLGLEEADHAEIRPGAAVPFIAPLSCSLVERSGKVLFAPGSRIRAAYGRDFAEEPYHCSYGLNPRYASLLHGRSLKVVAVDEDGDARAVELDGHSFFVATLFQPERAALHDRSHPLVEAYLAAAARGAGGPRA